MDLHPDAAVAKWLADHDSQTICRADALALGMTDKMIKFRLDTGQWRRLESGVYLVGANAHEWRTLLEAATHKLTAVVSYESAAYLHGFDGVRKGRRIVTVPVRTTRTFRGVYVHQSTDLLPEFVTRIDGLTVTTATRTLIDLAHDLSEWQLRRMAEICIIQGKFSLDELTEDFAKLGRRGRPGSAKMRKVLDELTPDLERIESELERLYLELVRTFGLPVPEVQVALPWRNTRTGRVDFVYRDAKLIIECDGRRWHRNSQAFEEDRRRDNRAMLAGWRVLRITWDMITKEPETVAAMVRDALDA